MLSDGRRLAFAAFWIQKMVEAITPGHKSRGENKTLASPASANREYIKYVRFHIYIGCQVMNRCSLPVHVSERLDALKASLWQRYSEFKAKT